MSLGWTHRQVLPMELLAQSPTRRIQGSHCPGLSRGPAALLQVPLLKGYSHLKATSSQLNTYLIIIRLGELPKRVRMLRSTLGKAPEKQVSCGPDEPSNTAGHGLSSCPWQRWAGVPGSPPAPAMPCPTSRGYSA